MASKDFKAELRAVRKFTGDAFSAARGYDARKPLNFGRRMAIDKYFKKIQELTSVETQIYTPKRGEKTEAFNYTGQTGFRKFTKAIVRKISPEQKFTFAIDKSRPKGHRFVATDTSTGRRYYNLPAYLFNSEEIDPEFYADVIREYAEDARFFLIQAGESYMWGAGGSADSIGQKLGAIFRNYSATMFDAHDKNSKYYGNWFNGVTGFTSQFDAIPLIREGQRKQAAYRNKYHIRSTKRYRRILGWGENGHKLVGEFENGELLGIKEATWDRERSPFVQGRQAAELGWKKEANPFAPALPEHKQWLKGWRSYP